MVIIITDYSPKYHSEVNRIFSEGIMSNVPQALSMSLTFYRFWILMVFTFLLGWIIHSWPFALLLVSCCIGMYCFTVYYCYRQYVRYVHLLIDKNLKWKKEKSLFPSEDVSIRNIFQCIDYNFVIEINNSMQSVFSEKKIKSMLRPIVLWAQPFTSSMKDLCIYV